MEIVYKIEDLVVKHMFFPYASSFVEGEFDYAVYKSLEKSIESKLRKTPELIIELLEEMPETKKRVFDRMRKFGGVKFYRYLDMENEVIKYVKANLEEMG